MTELTAERLKELLTYDPGNGVFLWKMTGRRAGWRNGNGYFRITIDDVRHYAHRLAWLWVHEEWPDEQIDHANGDPSDNRIANLRAATGSQNLANRRGRASCGFKGVHWAPHARRWRAQVTCGGKRVHLGYFDTPEAANAAYGKAADRLFGEFARIS